MSVAIAMIGSDGIVLASDGRESLDSTGEFQKHNVQKLIEITDKIWLGCASNYVGFTERIIDDFITKEIPKLKDRYEEKEWDIRLISRCFSLYTNREYLELIQNVPQKESTSQPIWATLENQIQFILAGYTKDTIPQPRIGILEVQKHSDLPPFTLQYYTFWIIGMPLVATYWLNKINLAKSLNNIDSAILRMLAIIAITEASKMTGNSLIGTPIQIVTIKSNNTVEKVNITENELKKVQTQLDAIVGEQVILDKLTKLSFNHDLITE